MDDILLFLFSGITTVLIKNNIYKLNEMFGGGRETIDLTNLQPDINKKENKNGKTIYAKKEKGKITPVFENPLNARNISPTKSVHISVPGLMPTSNDMWEDGTKTIYYMPNDKKPHFHGDAPHHMNMFDINEVYHMKDNKYYPTINKQIEKYRNIPGIIKFNNGLNNTPVEVWIHWRIPYNKKDYPVLIVKKNSIIWWDFTNHHNLVIVDSKNNYDKNIFTQSKIISKNKDINTLVTFMDKEGIFYFACSVSNHSKSGHKIIIQVTK